MNTDANVDLYSNFEEEGAVDLIWQSAKPTTTSSIVNTFTNQGTVNFNAGEIYRMTRPGRSNEIQVIGSDGS